MEEQINNIATVEAPKAAETEQPEVDAAPKKKRVTRSRKKVVAPVDEEPKEVQPETHSEDKTPQVENPAPAAAPAPAPEKHSSVKAVPRMPANLVIRDFCDLANNGSRIPLLNDQQIQQLTYDDAVARNLILEAVLSNVLDYDIVLSDTNIWLELLVGHTSSHSDPKVNARLMFERQLEFISKMCKKIGGKFMIMSETYEEVDRFATMQEPTDYKVADWKDEVLCRNVAARLAKRLMLSQQKENRLRIEGIGSESHHGAFADPAIIRRTVELFAEGKKVLLLTNDASVAIRSLGMCDDLQRYNKVSDKDWREIYEPQRPMVLTMDDLKLLDQFTRQYHFLMMAAGRQWMQDVPMRQPAVIEKPLELWLDGFRPGDRHERRSDKLEQKRKEQEQQRKEQERKEQQRQEQERREAEKQARREEQQRLEQEARERKEQQRQEQQRREEQRRADRERAAAEKAARLAAEEAARQQAAAEETSRQQAADDNNQPSDVAVTPAPSVASVAATAEAPAQDTPATESVVLPPLSPEAMELMGPSLNDKKRTRRGNRRHKPADTESKDEK